MELTLANNHFANFLPVNETIKWRAAVLSPVETIRAGVGSNLLEVPCVSQIFIKHPEDVEVGDDLFQRRTAISINLDLRHGGSVSIFDTTLTENLGNLFGRENCKFVVSFQCGRRVVTEFTSGEHELVATDNNQYRDDKPLNIPVGYLRYWISRPHDLRILGQFSVKLVLSSTAIVRLVDKIRDEAKVPSVGERILNQWPSDFVLKAEDGEVACHRMVLASHSPIFDAVLQSSFIEAQTQSYKLTGMTKGGVDALVDYIYKRDLTAATLNCEIAGELLKVGHMYLVDGLVGAIRQLVVVQPYTWFTLEVANRMLELAGLESELAEVEQKLVETIAWCNTKN